MLFKADILKEIAAGRVRLAFRAWDKPRIKAGTTLKTSAGVVAVRSIDPIEKGAISAREARLAGYASRDDLLDDLAARGADRIIYRIEVELVGADPRLVLRNAASLSDDDVSLLTRKLARMDAASRNGPWTDDVLALIERKSGIRAADLARARNEETLFFKTRLRRLKELGLTESLDVGYRLSPRGKAYLKQKLR